MHNEMIVEFDCPQCGAPAILEETSRLFVCDYCSVKSYLVPREVYHFVLPSRVPEDKAIIYFPYWRLKGVLFVCERARTINSERIDLTYQATSSDVFPRSLGFKTHVMKMRFVGPDLNGRFISGFQPSKLHQSYFCK